MTHPIDENRVATFLVPCAFVRDRPQLVQELLAQVLVVEARTLFAARAITYTGYSKQFDPVQEGTEPPRVYVVPRLLELATSHEVAAYEFSSDPVTR